MRILRRRSVPEVDRGMRPAYPRRPSAREAEIATLPLLQGVPAIWTIAVSLAIAGFQWRNLISYQRDVIPLIEAMYQSAVAKRDRELLTILGNVLRIGKLKGFFRRLFSTSK